MRSRLKYEHLFTKEDPEDVAEGADWLANINPKSVERLTACRVEPELARARAGQSYQFERLGYFCVDIEDSLPGKLVFNRAATLRDSWARIEKARR
jgi:glutaminyl-tRNA synthetase